MQVEWEESTTSKRVHLLEGMDCSLVEPSSWGRGRVIVWARSDGRVGWVTGGSVEVHAR
jgi:hypothetical protein